MSDAVIPSPADHLDHYVEETTDEAPSHLPPLPVRVTESVPVELRAAPAFTATSRTVPVVGGPTERIAPNDPTRRRLVVTNLGANDVVIADTDGAAAAGLGYTIKVGAQPLVMFTSAEVYAAAVGGVSTVAVLSESAPW